MQGVYAIVNTTNGHMYVGSAMDIPARWKQHQRYLKKGKHPSKHMQRAWNKYGEMVFSFKVLEVVRRKENLIATEQRYLDQLKKQHNLSQVRFGQKTS